LKPLENLLFFSTEFFVRGCALFARGSHFSIFIALVTVKTFEFFACLHNQMNEIIGSA